MSTTRIELNRSESDLTQIKKRNKITIEGDHQWETLELLLSLRYLKTVTIF